MLVAWPRPSDRDDELELRIESLAYGGNGVARLNGFVVFVRRGLPGDIVRARVTKVKRNHAEALAVEVVEPGAPRVDAPCEHYPACGGCRFQDLAYEAQLEAKAAQVEEALRRIGRLDDPPLEPIVPAESRLPLPEQARVLVHGRHRTAPRSASTAPAAGTRCSTSASCWLTTDLGNAIREAVRDWARAQGLVAYDQAEHTGFLRHLVVREGAKHGPGARPARDGSRQARRGELRRRARRASPRCGRSTGRSTTAPPR